MLQSSASLTTTLDRASIGLYQVCIIIICFALNTLDGFDITAMAVVAQDVSVELDLGAESWGLIFSASLYPTFCFTIRL